MPAASATPPAWRQRRVQVGDWQVTELSDGFMRLDGGSMWGVVPRPMWSAMTPAADDNTIPLALRPFLARKGELCVLIEGGVGRRWEPKWRGIYQMQATVGLEETLGEAGVEPGDVTHVVLSHCHWDHIGGLVVRKGGDLAPLFPRARHFAPAIEIEVAKRPGHARRASYRAQDVRPLEDLGLLAPYTGGELLPGLRAHVLGGHSDGVALITLGEGGGGDTAVFWSDVVPTTHHVQPAYIMAFDIDVVRSFEQRSAWLERAASAGWIGLYYHDVDHAFGRIERDGKRYVHVAVPEEGAGA